VPQSFPPSAGPSPSRGNAAGFVDQPGYALAREEPAALFAASESGPDRALAQDGSSLATSWQRARNMFGGNGRSGISSSSGCSDWLWAGVPHPQEYFRGVRAPPPQESGSINSWRFQGGILLPGDVFQGVRTFGKTFVNALVKSSSCGRVGMAQLRALFRHRGRGHMKQHRRDDFVALKKRKPEVEVRPLPPLPAFHVRRSVRLAGVHAMSWRCRRQRATKVGGGGGSPRKRSCSGPSSVRAAVVRVSENTDVHLVGRRRLGFVRRYERSATWLGPLLQQRIDHKPK